MNCNKKLPQAITRLSRWCDKSSAVCLTKSKVDSWSQLNRFKTISINFYWLARLLSDSFVSHFHSNGSVWLFYKECYKVVAKFLIKIISKDIDSRRMSKKLIDRGVNDETQELVMNCKFLNDHHQEVFLSSPEICLFNSLYHWTSQRHSRWVSRLMMKSGGKKICQTSSRRLKMICSSRNRFLGIRLFNYLWMILSKFYCLSRNNYYWVKWPNFQSLHFTMHNFYLY